MPAVAGLIIFIVAIAIAVAIMVAKPYSFDAEFVEPSDSASGLAIHATAGETAETDANAKGLLNTDTSNTDTSSTDMQTVFVHVAGQVVNPGVYELSAGARVNEAIAAAGGISSEAVTDTINLARIVTDGEQIFVPDDATPVQSEIANHMGGGLNGGSGTGSLVSVNSASKSELESLPGIGPAIASRIIAWREANGGFAHLEDLMLVSGIGPKLFENLKDLVSL